MSPHLLSQGEMKGMSYTLSVWSRSPSTPDDLCWFCHLMSPAKRRMSIFTTFWAPHPSPHRCRGWCYRGRSPGSWRGTCCLTGSRSGCCPGWRYQSLAPSVDGVIDNIIIKYHKSLYYFQCHVMYGGSLMLPAFSSASIHLGSTSEKKMENPSTNRFRVEFRSTNCRLERPT